MHTAVGNFLPVVTTHSSLQTILGVTVPFFALVLFGYVAARRRWVPTDAVPAFNGFLLYFAVPALLFRFASNTPFAEITNGAYFLAWGISGILVVLLVTFVAWRFLRLRDAAVRIFLNPFLLSMLLGATFSGMGWRLGTPLMLVAALPPRAGSSSSRCATRPMGDASPPSSCGRPRSRS